MERFHAPTNLFRLRVATRDLDGFRARLRARGVDIGSVRSDGTFMLGVNETWSRASADALADRFIAAV